MLPTGEICGQALPRQPDECRREIDRDDMRAAPGGFDRQGAGAAAGIEHRTPRRSCGSQDSSVARMLSRPARTVARMRLTGASEVSRAQASAAVRSK